MQLTPAVALKAIEEAMQVNAGTHGERWRTRPVAHHLLKGIGHAARAGRHGTAIDEDSGLPHLVLGATRLVLAVAVLLEGQRLPGGQSSPTTGELEATGLDSGGCAGACSAGGTATP